MYSYVMKIFHILGNMPHKFQRYVPKRYSWKGYKPKNPTQLSILSIQNSKLIIYRKHQPKYVDFGTQTGEILNDVVPVIENEEVGVVDMVDAEVQVGEQQSQRVCVGHVDEKFNSLNNKHNGVFKDSTGM